MDPFEQLPEAPDLSGQVTQLGYRPVFIGPYSCVFQGKLDHNGEMVAIKVINPVEGSALHTMRRKLNRERRAWGALNHPNILPLYGFADDSEIFQPFGALISPWRQQGDASRFLADHGDSLTLDQRIDLWRDVLSGVNYLHTHKPVLIHGDLKPRNILIDDFGRAQICDFGLVRIFMDEGSSGMTTTTHHTGTERYLAYELALAGEDAVPTTASDIYAAGCIGLVFVFSQIPYSDCRNNLSGVIYLNIRNGIAPAERPRTLSSHLESLWNLLESCWDRDYSERPSATVLLQQVTIQRINFFNEPNDESAWSDCDRGITTGTPSDLGRPDPSLLLLDELEDDDLNEYMDDTSPPGLGVDPPFESLLSHITPQRHGSAQKIYEYQNKYRIDLSFTTSRHLEIDDSDGRDGWCLVSEYGRDQPAGPGKHQYERHCGSMKTGEELDENPERYFRNHFFQCVVSGCSHNFAREADLKNHMDSYHPHNKTHLCRFCGQFYGLQGNLASHIRLNHSGILSSDD